MMMGGLEEPLVGVDKVVFKTLSDLMAKFTTSSALLLSEK